MSAPLSTTTKSHCEPCKANSILLCLLAVLWKFCKNFLLCDASANSETSTVSAPGQQTLDIITSRSMAVILKCNGMQIHTTSITALTATNVEINVWTTPKQYMQRADLLHSLLLQKMRLQRFKSVRRRLVYDDC